MGSEPRWLIGGPEQSAETVNQESDQVTVEPEASEPAESTGMYQGKTAAQWRQMATEGRQRSMDSFVRSDTDGALTQWANDTMSRKYMLCAELAEKDGFWEFPALFTLTGALVPEAVWLKTKLNKWVWRIGSGPTVAWFDPSRARSGARRRANDAAKGYVMGTVRQRGYVASTGSGRGIAGATTVGFYIRQDEESPIEIVDNGSLGTQYKDW